MGIIELFLIGVGLAMDAFAVAICKGLNMRKMNYAQATVIALFFGGFQALMPFLGWSLGRNFEHYIVSIDHWIAFGLLSLIGIQMLREGFYNDEEKESKFNPLDYKVILTLAVATSIDALAVGVSLTFMGVNYWNEIAMPVAIITIIMRTRFLPMSCRSPNTVPMMKVPLRFTSPDWKKGLMCVRAAFIALADKSIWGTNT